MSRAHSHDPMHSHDHGHSHDHDHDHDHAPTSSAKPHKGHSHSHASAHRSQRSLALILLCTATFTIAEIIGGLWTGSLSLLADAGHMATDVLGLVISLLAAKLATRPPTLRHSFGFHRAEILAALSNALLLFGVCCFVLIEAYQRLLHPHDVASKPMLVIACLGLGVNLFGMWLLHQDAKESLNLRGAYAELLSDAISSVGAIVAAVLIWITGWRYVDPLISVGIGFFMIPRAFSLLRETVSILLEGTPEDIDLAAVRKLLETQEGVVSVHDLHVWSLTSGRHSLSVHVIVQPGCAPDDLISQLRTQLLAQFQIDHITVQTETRCCAPQTTHQ